MGGAGKIVEADETYFGNTETSAHVSKQRKGRPYKGRTQARATSAPILSLVERGGRVRSFHVAGCGCARPSPKIVRENIHRESRLHTDESRLYHGSRRMNLQRMKPSITRAKEYARGDVTTNTVESYFSVFKRGMRGVYQHCNEKHLHRYLAEFDFRFNNRTALGVTDGERAALAIKGIEGKRLTYRLPH